MTSRDLGRAEMHSHTMALEQKDKIGSSSFPFILPFFLPFFQSSYLAFMKTDNLARRGTLFRRVIVQCTNAFLFLMTPHSSCQHTQNYRFNLFQRLIQIDDLMVELFLLQGR